VPFHEGLGFKDYTVLYCTHGTFKLDTANLKNGGWGRRRVGDGGVRGSSVYHLK